MYANQNKTHGITLFCTYNGYLVYNRFIFEKQPETIQCIGNVHFSA